MNNWKNIVCLMLCTFSFTTKYAMDEKTGSAYMFEGAMEGNSYLLLKGLKLGAKIDETDSSGLTPLELAALMGHSSIFEILKKHHYLPDQKIIDKAFLLAVSSNKWPLDALILFLNSVLDVNIADTDTLHTPLIKASIYNNAELLDLLLKHGADASRIDLCGRTAVDYALENENKKIFNLLTVWQTVSNYPEDKIELAQLNEIIDTSNLELAVNPNLVLQSSDRDKKITVEEFINNFFTSSQWLDYENQMQTEDKGFEIGNMSSSSIWVSLMNGDKFFPPKEVRPYSWGNLKEYFISAIINIEKSTLLIIWKDKPQDFKITTAISPIPYKMYLFAKADKNLYLTWENNAIRPQFGGGIWGHKFLTTTHKFRTSYGGAKLTNNCTKQQCEESETWFHIG